MSYSDLLITHVAIEAGQSPDWEAAEKFLEYFPEGLTDDQKVVLAETQPDFDESPEGLEEFSDSLLAHLDTFKEIWGRGVELGDAARLTIGALDVLIAGGPEGEIGQMTDTWDLIRDLTLAGVLAAAGFITSEDGRPQQAWTVTWSHRHGEDIAVHTTSDLAYGWMADICRRDWDDEINGRGKPDRQPPEDDREVITEYFEEVESESYSITPVPIETATREALVAS